MFAKEGATGLRFTVKEEVTLLPSAVTGLVCQPSNVSANTDAKGIASMAVPAGLYTITITTPRLSRCCITKSKGQYRHDAPQKYYSGKAASRRAKSEQ